MKRVLIATAALALAVTGLTDAAADKAKVTTYQGIHYAHADRWGPPKPVGRWRGETSTPRACPQPTDIPIAPADQAEDCLTLNVTTAHRKNRPVIVYIHGGSFNYGAGANYRPDDLVRQGDVVAVTINYRLGVLGWLAHPEFGPDAGNLGLADQQTALRWVRDNITRFGGDPRDVTIMGQSAGGYSVCAHLASPASAGLFHRAIVQSAGCTGGVRDRATAERAAVQLATDLGCPDGSCLRGMDAQDLVAASGTGHDEYRPVAGGRLLPVEPAKAFASGRFNRVPVLFGGNHDEDLGQLAGMVLAGAPPITEDNYAEKVAESFGADAAAVLAEYPLTPDRTPVETLAAALTDRDWALPIEETRRLLARHVPVYAYEFAERDASWFPGFPPPPFPVGASHMMELPYLFDVRYLTPATKESLRDTMIDRWTRFAHTGDPGWQSYRRGGGYVLSLASGDLHRTDYEADHKLAFWRGLA